MYGLRVWFGRFWRPQAPHRRWWPVPLSQPGVFSCKKRRGGKQCYHPEIMVDGHTRRYTVQWEMSCENRKSPPWKYPLNWWSILVRRFFCSSSFIPPKTKRNGWNVTICLSFSSFLHWNWRCNVCYISGRNCKTLYTHPHFLCFNCSQENWKMYINYFHLNFETVSQQD